jgi:undecaprenyl-diphosphatase
MDSVVIFCAKYLFLVAILILGFVWLKATRAKKIELMGAVVITGIIAYALMKFAGWLYYDPRPFVTQHIKPLVAHGADNGFPSEHTVFTMAISTVIYCYNKQLGVAAFIITLIVGISRVLAHVHLPIDIIGGVLIGVIAGVIGYKISERIFRAKRFFKKPSQKE